MRIDPVTLEVLRGRLDVIAEEMQIGLIRSAYSNVVKESADASAAIFDLRGQTLAQAAAIPIHLGVLVPAVGQFLRVFPPDTMREGDVYLLNDPYDGGTHLPDLIVGMPVFVNHRPVAMIATITHHQDVGGKTPGSIPTDATDIYQEGLRIPAMKLHDAGVENATLLAILGRNVRFPDELRADLDAQVSACRLGGRRLHETIDEYGETETHAYISALLNRAEQLTRAKIADIPDGRYTFEDYLDNDGIELDRRIRLRVAVVIDGSDVSIDFEGTDAQVRGPVNATPPNVLAAAYSVLRAITDPSIPNNAGCYRPLRLRLPEGSLVNPRPPAAVNARMPTFNLIVDALLGAFAQAVPDRIPAASYDSFTTSFGGVDPDTSQAYVFTDIGCGGFGARPSMDGVDVFRKGGVTLNPPIETIEMDFPLRVHRYALRRDSGGAGRFRGGLGYEKVFEVLRGQATVSHRGERYFTAPWGLSGGGPAATSASTILRSDGSREVIPSKRVFLLQAGERVCLMSAGGGGHGDPLERRVEAVRTDVLDGKVSVEAALAQYGVAIDPETLEIDTARTAEARRRNGRPTDGGRGSMLREWASDMLVSAIEENIIEHFLLFGRLPGAQVGQGADLTWVITGVPHPLLNGVWRTSLAADAEAKVDEMVGRFETRRVPLRWLVGPSTRPTNLGSILERHGVAYARDWIGMARDLRTLDDEAEGQSPVRVERVRDREKLERWAEVFCQGNGLEPLVGSAFLEIFSSQGLGDGSSLRHYLGYLEGEAVATSTLFLGTDVAGIYWVATTPRARNHGVGTRMTLAALRDARAAGYRYTVLHATQMGVNVYRRLGFSDLCTIGLYLCQEPRRLGIASRVSVGDLERSGSSEKRVG